MKQHEEIRNLTIDQGKYNTTGILLDYDDVKNHHKSKAVNLSEQKK